MSSNGHPMYELRQLARATAQMKELAAVAIERGVKKDYVAALRSIAAKLASNPKEYGDPERHLHKPGALMYHGVFGPLYVQYIVFETEKIVLIVKVIAMPSSPLDLPND